LHVLVRLDPIIGVTTADQVVHDEPLRHVALSRIQDGSDEACFPELLEMVAHSNRKRTPIPRQSGQ
jgi:hypothetical protein